MFPRLIRFFRLPFYLVFARVFPVRYAKFIGVNITGKVTIYGGSYSMFGSEPYLVTLADNVFISVDTQFVTHDGGVLPFRKDIPDLDLAAPISVGSNTFIGTKVLIMKGVDIGENCVVGAGSIVTKSVPDGSIVAGIPARVVKSTEEYLENGKKNSLKIGHLPEMEKHAMYKKIFNVKQS